MRSTISWGLLFVAAWLSPAGWAAEPETKFAPSWLAPLTEVENEIGAIGVSRGDSPILAVSPRPAPSVVDASRRLVLVAGLSKDDPGVAAAIELYRQLRHHEALAGWTITLVPRVRPDATSPASTGQTTLQFPPADDAYLSPEPEGQYLWRWLAMHGPDAVIEVRSGQTTRWYGPGTETPLRAGELAEATARSEIAGIGSIPGWRIDVSDDQPLTAAAFAEAWQRLAPREISAARAALQARAARSPRGVATGLAKHYGHSLDPVEYLQGTAVLARLRLARAIGDQEMEADATRIAAAWLGKRTVDDNSSGSVFAGHLVFAELARTTDESGYIDLVLQVADRGFAADGTPREAMPGHSEMSDAVFMSTPMLVEAGKLTGESKYYEMALRHLKFMLGLNLRDDGLHRHSPLDETAWGRGNGFPALGLAMCLDQLPATRPEHAEMLTAFRNHLAALRRHQDSSGMWHQVIDRPESYRELTATCMITYAMLRGVQQGWLEEDYIPAIRKAWEALKLRIGDDGALVDVCTGTGKQRSLRDYFDRQAILGKDNRGGAMSLLVATEYARWTDGLAAAALGKRVPWTTSRIVGSPDPPLPFQLTNAFPGLDFNGPVSLHAMPNLPGAEPDRMLVLQEDGKILTFLAGATNPQVELVADFSATPPPLSGLAPEDSKRISVYSLAFHPDFATNRRVVICYIVSRGARRPDGSHIASFELSRSEPPQLVMSSELPILQFDSGGHNGCTVAFGNDRMLYISTGDVAAPNPPDVFDHGQNVGDVYSAILRIDIDHADEGRGYSIPPDNPFVNLAGARPEIYAYGFRNPWRMSFDAPTGDLWVGDVGWEAWEMVYRIRSGGNYGWPIKEGPGDVRTDAKRGPTPIRPADIALSHADAASVTGGVVYRGQRFPALQGQYIFGDWITRRFWAAEFDAERVIGFREIAAGGVKPVSFELDHQGELLILDYNSGGRSSIYRLEPNPAQGQQVDFPRRLSETGLVASTQPLAPAAGVVPYSINAPMFRDGATAEYWLAVPGEEPPTFYASPQTTFDWFRTGVLLPPGSVIAKTYWLPRLAGDAESRRPVETQIAHNVARGEWNHYTYRWNEAATDAELVDAGGGFMQLEIADPEAAGGKVQLNWSLAARSQCRTCHTPWRGEALGLSETQLRGPGALRGDTDADSWHQLLAGGWIRTDAPRAAVAGEPTARLVNPHDTNEALELRARSYLHANCAHCHLEGGNASVSMDVIHTKPLAATGLLDARPMRGDFRLDSARLIAPGEPARSTLLYRLAKLGSGRMPPLGIHGADLQGIDLISRWIEQLRIEAPPVTTPPASSVPPLDPTEVARSTEATARYRQWLAQLAVSAEPTEAAALPSTDTPPAAESEGRLAAIRGLLGSPSGSLALAAALAGRRIDAALLPTVIREAASAPPEIAELFETWLPESDRVARLGTDFDPALVLNLEGDPEAGRQAFIAGRGQCSQCHLIQGQGLNVGPDLSRIGVKYERTADLLRHVTQPSLEIAEAYRAIIVLTDAGQTLTGRVLDRTDQTLRLQDATGRLIEIASDTIEQEKPAEKSLMPENLLDGLTAPQAADLLAYLRSLR